MAWELVKAIILLPGTALGLIPALILAVTGVTPISNELTLFNLLRFWLGLLLTAAGGGLAVWTIVLFMRYGDGSRHPGSRPANWLFAAPTAMCATP